MCDYLALFLFSDHADDNSARNRCRFFAFLVLFKPYYLQKKFANFVHIFFRCFFSHGLTLLPQNRCGSNAAVKVDFLTSLKHLYFSKVSFNPIVLVKPAFCARSSMETVINHGKDEKIPKLALNGLFYDKPQLQIWRILCALWRRNLYFLRDAGFGIWRVSV